MEKSLLTFLACCNAIGEKTFPAMIIGNANCTRPRAFRRHLRKELSFNYWAYESLRDKRSLFDWLLKFDSFISATHGRNFSAFAWELVATWRSFELTKAEVRDGSFPSTQHKYSSPTDWCPYHYLLECTLLTSLAILATCKLVPKACAMLKLLQKCSRSRRNATFWNRKLWSIAGSFSWIPLKKVISDRTLFLQKLWKLLKGSANEHGIQYSCIGLENILNLRKEFVVTKRAYITTKVFIIAWKEYGCSNKDSQE